MAHRITVPLLTWPYGPRSILASPRPNYLPVPKELRNKIMSYLLIDPMLGQYDSVDLIEINRSGRYRTRPPNICTSILYVCKQAYVEYSEFLYTEITFYFACTQQRPNSWDIQDPFIMSAMLPRGHQLSLCEQQYAPVHRIQKCKLVISAASHTAASRPCEALAEFCQNISALNLQSLDVAVIPKGMESNTSGKYDCISDVLEPLKFIRNVAEVTIRDAELSEVADIVTQTNIPVTFDSFITNKENYLIKVIKELAAGDTPIELGDPMYRALLAYAQAFERYEPFRVMMNRDVTQGGDHVLGRRVEFYAECNIVNPSIGPIVHPVEKNLRAAKSAKHMHDLSTFKFHRNEVLCYLENQYRDIEAAFINLVEFIKDKKCMNAMFDWRNINDPNFNPSHNDVADAMELLEAYAKAFVREIPDEMEEQFAPHQERIEAIYKTMVRRFLLGRLRQAVLINDYGHFSEWFHAAIKELDTQYFEIQNTRNCLLDGDTFDEPMCALELEVIHLNMEIDWKAHEPFEGPEKYDFSRHWTYE